MNGKIYVAGGEGSGGGLLSSIEVYDPTSRAWSHFADLPINVTDLGCTTYGSASFYMAGGWTLSGMPARHYLCSWQNSATCCMRASKLA